MSENSTVSLLKAEYNKQVTCNSQNQKTIFSIQNIENKISPITVPKQIYSINVVIESVTKVDAL